MHVGRKAVFIATRSRRWIPGHWNERFQEEHPEKSQLEMRKAYHRRERRKVKENIAIFSRDRFEDFCFLYFKNCVSKNDW
jgi:hypothetical protein